MYEEIKEQVKEVIRYSQNISEPMVDSLFEKWEKNKARFIDRFGGLIYEWPKPIEFTLDSKEKEKKAAEFANVVSDTFNNPTLAQFIDENLDTFFDNKVSKNTNTIKVPEGMKLIKAFKFFENNEAILRTIQDQASLIIQENKIKGTLCFSVHPLDFLSSSENTYNWRSCHALNGEYRAGNLSYMADEATFMVYLKGADHQYLTGFGLKVPWNSKKWRMLIHESPNGRLIFAGRQYPFSSKSGIDSVLNIYNNIIAAKHAERANIDGMIYPWCYGTPKYAPWRADYVDTYTSSENSEVRELDKKYFVYDEELLWIRDIVHQGPNSLNYNDILSSSCYIYPYYAVLNPNYYYSNASNVIKNPIVIGEQVLCLHCGKDLITNPETMRCDDCEVKYGYEDNDMFGSCACCGTRIFIDEAICVGDYGEPVCDSCYDTECFTCDCCGEAFFNSDRVYVDEEDCDGTWYCKYCYDNYKNT